MIKNGADVDLEADNDVTPLKVAIGRENHDITEILIDNSADVNKVDSFGYSLLHYTALRGYKDLTSLLVSKAAEINAMDDNGRTPLDRATDTEIISFLRSHGGLTGEEIREQGNKETRKK